MNSGSHCASETNKSSTKKTINVVCAVLSDYNGHIFAARRPAGSSLADHWEFPGGKIKPNESHEEALEREIREELDVFITLGDTLPPSSFEYDFGTVILHPFKAIIAEGCINLKEHSECVWLPKEKLLSLKWAPADIPIVEAMISE